jgi:hypothetical protein
LGDGAHNFTATVTDAAGNKSGSSNTIDSFIGQISAPTILSFSPHTGLVSNDITDATITGSAEPNSTVAVFEGSVELGTTTANNVGSWNYTTGRLATGSYSFTATDTIGGNTSPVSVGLTAAVETKTPTGNGAVRYTASVAPHGDHGKLIDASTLDAIFGTANTPSSHHSNNASTSLTIDNHATETVIGALPVTHSDHTDTVTASNTPLSGTAGLLSKSPSTASVNLPEIDSEATLTRNSNAGQGNFHSDAANSTISSADSGGQWHAGRSIMTETVNSSGSSDPPDPHGLSLSIAGILSASADTFVFKPDLGDEPVKVSNTANELADTSHTLYATLAELHANLHFALDHALVGDETAVGQPITQSPHIHDFHLV